MFFRKKVFLKEITIMKSYLQKARSIMNLKKRRVFASLAVLSLSTLSLFVGGKALIGTNETKNNGIEVEEISGIEITNKRTIYNANRTTTTIVNYSIGPSTADGYTLVDMLDWSTHISSQWESTSWGENENPETYVTHSLDTSKSTITFTCLKPFGRSLEYTLTCQENPAVKATINIDYVREVTKKATGQFASTILEDNKPFSVNVTEATYCIGSKGERPAPTIEIKTCINGDWNDLFPSSIDLSGFSDTENVIYDSGNGETTMKASAALESMKTRTREYFDSVVKSQGSINFQRSELIKRMTYKKSPVAYASPITFTSVGENFIKKYKTILNGLGVYEAMLYVNGEKVQDSTLQLNVKASDISTITVGQGQIDF